ncbi:YbaK/EbsC family protein [Candidatus Bathyarchaeota archaeon]|nr:YbaK/EbsC family protein [Candidatus Bathyarchaeota archaeon]MBS7630607.1 YbaK/EbsC family protein [Candidatus Bathyarchaeota archaeon]
MLESEKILKTMNVNYKLIKLKNRAVTVEDVIKYSDEELNLDEICKTIILKDYEGNLYAAFLLGSHKIDFKKLEKATGAKYSIVKAQEIEEKTKMSPGAVCPLLLRVPILLDKRVLEKRKVNFGSGDHLYGLEIATDDLKRVFSYRIVDIANV